jgi:hypothetical protein
MKTKLDELVESLDGYVLDRKVVGSSTLWEIYFPAFTLDLTYSDKGWKFRFESLVETLKFECDTVWYLDFVDLKKKLESTIVRFDQVQPDYSCLDLDYPEDDEETDGEKAYWAKRQQESDKLWKKHCDEQWKQHCYQQQQLYRADMLR